MCSFRLFNITKTFLLFSCMVNLACNFLRILYGMFVYIHRCKLTCMMATGKTLVQLRLSIMQIWESPKSLCLTSGKLYRLFNISIILTNVFQR